MDKETEELKRKLRLYEKKFGKIYEKRGLHNWKNLFRAPTLYEWVILFMMLMALFMAWAYQHDIAECQEFISNFATNFNDLQYNITQATITNYNLTKTEVNLSGLINFGEVSDGAQG